MNSESEIEDEISRILSEEIDWAILSDLLVTISGWIQVTTPPVTEVDCQQMREWATANCTGTYRENGGPTWVFESEIDASLFALRWA